MNTHQIRLFNFIKANISQIEIEVFFIIKIIANKFASKYYSTYTYILREI